MRPHAIENRVAVDELMLQRRCDMERHERRQRPGAGLVGERHDFREFGVDRRDVGDRRQAEQTHRDRYDRRRDAQPADQRNRRQHRVERGVDETRGGAGRPRPARRRRRSGAHSAGDEARRQKDQRQPAQRFVRLVEVELARRIEVGRGRRQTQREHERKPRRRQPVERDHAAGPARRWRLHPASASLDTVKSTSREMIGKPEFMP